MLFRLFAAISIAAVISDVSAATPVLNDPYGVHAHVTRWERTYAADEFPLVRKAGINWVRAECDWRGAELKPGQWDFSERDRVYGLARKEGVNILSTLGNEAAWATPAWKHPDLWSEYVRTIVGRYKDSLRHWEVWNEPNSDYFWHDTPNAKNYTSLLKRTYEEIKKIDSDLVVLYAGLAHVPLEFIEESLQAGARDSFDVMNVHPYHWDSTPESRMREELLSLQALMTRYKMKQPVWITEIGWSSAKRPNFRPVLSAALEHLQIRPEESSIAFAVEQSIADTFTEDLPRFKNRKLIRLEDIKSLNVKEFPILVPAVGQRFCSDYFPELVDYLKRGGTLLFTDGLPLYYDIRQDGRKIQVNDKYAKQLRIGWETWWLDGRVPKLEKWQKPSPGFEGRFELPVLQTGRFLTSANLKSGDKFIPLMDAGAGDYRGVAAGIYQLNSDLKGNIIVCPTIKRPETVSEEKQAQLLPRIFLVAFACGVEKAFWYELRSPEHQIFDRESHFGLLSKNLVPKPAFLAYRTLIQLCPSGSTVPELIQEGELFIARWKNPEGVKIQAVWTEYDNQKVKCSITGENVRVMNHAGEEQSLSGTEVTASSGILYIVGAENVSSSR